MHYQNLGSRLKFSRHTFHILLILSVTKNHFMCYVTVSSQTPNVQLPQLSRIKTFKIFKETFYCKIFLFCLLIIFKALHYNCNTWLVKRLLKCYNFGIKIYILLRSSLYGNRWRKNWVTKNWRES